MKTNKIYLSTAILSLLATSAIAQETFELDDIIISGGFTPIPLADSASSVSVITSEQISEAGDITILTLLKRVPGVAVSESGGFNSVRIRGGEANHALVLIDGVAITGDGNGYQFHGISAENIEKIEILRGPQTVFYGPAASSGVINIITKDASDTDLAHASIQAGERTGVAFSDTFSAFNTKNRVSFSKTSSHKYDYSFQNGDKDGFDRNTISLNSYGATDGDVSFDLSIRASEENFDYDGASAGPENTYVVSNASNGQNNENQIALTIKKYGTNRTSSNEIKIQNSIFSNTQNDVVWGLTKTKITKTLLQYHHKTALDGALVNNSKNTVSFVGETYRDQNQYLNSEKRDGNAAALEYRHISKNGNLLQAGLRHDKSTQFSDATTWKLGYVIALNQKQTSISLDAGTGVVNPTYLERFGGYGYYTGGENLLPEKNTSISIGLHHNIAQNEASISTTAFQDQLTNEIVFQGARTINEDGKSTRKGLETELQTNISDWAKFRLSHTFLVAKNSDNSIEIRRPRHTLNTSTDLNSPFANGKFTIRTTTVVGNWDNYTDGSGAKKLPNYTLLDFSFSKKISEDINFVAEINNLFDRNHKETWGYNVKGRSAVIKLAKSW